MQGACAAQRIDLGNMLCILKAHAMTMHCITPEPGARIVIKLKPLFAKMKPHQGSATMRSNLSTAHRAAANP
jgi:hypothetical protein